MQSKSIRNLPKIYLFLVSLHGVLLCTDATAFTFDKPEKQILTTTLNVAIRYGVRRTADQLIHAFEARLHPTQYGGKGSKPQGKDSTPAAELVELKDMSTSLPTSKQSVKQSCRSDPRLTALDDILEKLAQQAEAMNIIVILSFDIDDTMYYPSDNAEAMMFERNVLDIFHQWLTTGHGSNRFILIPNTARQYSSHWQDQMRHQHFPEPFIIIHSNGSKIELSNNLPSWAPLFSANRVPLQLASNRLLRTLAQHNDLAKEHLDSEYGDAEFARLYSDIQEFSLGKDDRGHAIAIPGAVSVFEGVNYGYFLWALNEMKQASGAHKYISQQADPRYLIYYDRSVNKGAALVFLLSELLPLLPEESTKMLFTAGDDIYDLPMLFMDLLGQAFYPPPDRNPEELAEDLTEIGVSREELQSVQQIWQAGILPSSKSTELVKALSQSSLDSSDRLLHAEEASLHSILSQIYQYITPSSP